MYSNATEKLQDEVKKVVNQLDQEYLRKMQAQMHRCAAACCDDVYSSPENVQRCVENCGSRLLAIKKFVHGEFDNFQDRLNRCQMACSDSVRDKVGAMPSESEIERYRNELEKCSSNCAETHIQLISQIYKRTKEVITKNSFLEASV